MFGEGTFNGLMNVKVILLFFRWDDPAKMDLIVSLLLWLWLSLSPASPFAASFSPSVSGIPRGRIRVSAAIRGSNRNNIVTGAVENRMLLFRCEVLPRSL